MLVPKSSEQEQFGKEEWDRLLWGDVSSQLFFCESFHIPLNFKRVGRVSKPQNSIPFSEVGIGAPIYVEDCFPVTIFPYQKS